MAKNVVLKISQKGARKTVTSLKAVSGALSGIGVKAAIATSGFAVFSTKLAGDFQKNLFEVRTLLGDTGQSINSMSKELRNASASSGLALSSLSKAKYDIVSAGFANAAQSAKLLSATSNLAVAGVTSAASAADLLTTALNAFGQEADEATRASDVLVTTVRLGKTTMDELAASLGQVLPFARSAGLSLEGVGAAMATMTASGINTAESTTALKSAIVQLTSPTKGAKDAMEKASIEVVRFKDGSLDLVETIKQFVGVPQDTLTKFIPNVRAVAAIQTMANNFEVLKNNVDELTTNSANATANMVAQMDQAFNTQFAKLRNNVQNVMIEIGNSIIEVLQPKIEEANTLLLELGNIGFDNIANAIVGNMSTVMETLNAVIFLSMDTLENHIKLVGLKIKRELADLVPSFLSNTKELDKEIESATKAMVERNASNFKNIQNQLSFTFDLIAEKAKEGAKASGELAEGTIEQDNLVVESKLNIRRAEQENIDKLFERFAVIKKVNDESKVGQIELLKMKKDALQQDIKSAMLSQSSAKEAMRAVVRAEAMEATAGLVAGIFKTIPPPLSIVLAAGAGAVVSSALDKGMSTLGFAQGGIVPGIGSGDSVPAMLTPGELILNKAQQENLVNNNQSVVVNIDGGVVDESYVANTLVPALNKATSLGSSLNA